MTDKHVCRKNPQSRTKLSAAIGAGWARVSHRLGKGAFADAAGFDAVTLNRALTGPSLPSAEHLLNSLCAEPTALDEVLKLYGLKVSPAVSDPANDFELASKLGHTLAEMIERLGDGKRCHVDTAVLAALFRQIIPQMQAIIDEDDKRRAAA
jgi:hypothetical protein